MTGTLARAKNAIQRAFSGETDDKGYTHWPQDNLLPGISLGEVEDDLRRGDGDELRMKFCAVHSSAALAVNTFAHFKRFPFDVRLLGRDGAVRVEFEKHLRIFRGGRAPNIDVWIDREDDAVAIESKCLEYLTLKQPHFSVAYDRLVDVSDPRWWRAYLDAKDGEAQHLDRAQLIKHYFGLKALQKKTGTPPAQLTLLYLFWEPLNWQVSDECQIHREELKVFADVVGDTAVEFRWMTYNELWDEWANASPLRHHAARLKERYQVRL